MSILPHVEPLELSPGESVVAEWFADQMHGDDRFRGKLILTNQRLAYRPTDMGLAMGAVAALAGTTMPKGTAWTTALTDIEALDDDGASEKMGERGRVLRARLATGGSQVFFVITDPEACAAAVRAALA